MRPALDAVAATTSDRNSVGPTVASSRLRHATDPDDCTPLGVAVRRAVEYRGAGGDDDSCVTDDMTGRLIIDHISKSCRFRRVVHEPVARGGFRLQRVPRSSVASSSVRAPHTRARGLDSAIGEPGHADEAENGRARSPAIPPPTLWRPGERRTPAGRSDRSTQGLRLPCVSTSARVRPPRLLPTRCTPTSCGVRCAP